MPVPGCDFRNGSARIGAVTRRANQQFVLAAALTALLAGQAAALETDQYYTWGTELADATDVVNAKLNLEMERAIAAFDRPPEQCIAIAKRFRKRMRFLLFHHVQTWTLHTSLVERMPEAGPGDLDYRRTNLYHNHGLFDFGMWMPITPTIQVNGVRIGTDKLSHFLSSGWTYYGSYRRALKHGKTPAEAADAAGRRGVLEEKLILGAAASGILSLADLEANFQGMLFYLDLCSGDDPILVDDGGGWRLGRPIDLRDYVHPGWDESYNNSIFRDSRWRKVQPVLKGYCDRRGHPQVQEMLARYRDMERRTAAGSVVAELLAEGKLQDPGRFSLDANCPDPVAAVVASPAGHPPAPRGEAVVQSDEDARSQVIAEEATAERRLVGLTAVRLAYPQVASVSLGAVATKLPAAYDCRTPCDMWGAFGQLEPGIGGGKVSIGYGRIIGEHHRGGRILSNVYLALGLKGTVLRTWGSASREPVGHTYAGPEFEFSIARVNMGIGALNRIRGDEGSEWIATAHLGWGF